MGFILATGGQGAQENTLSKCTGVLKGTIKKETDELCAGWDIGTSLIHPMSLKVEHAPGKKLSIRSLDISSQLFMVFLPCIYGN